MENQENQDCQVNPKRKIFSLPIIVIGLFIVLLIILVCWPSHPNHQRKKKMIQRANRESIILKRNADRLAKMQVFTVPKPTSKPKDSFLKKLPNKQLKARQHAPTQMYDSPQEHQSSISLQREEKNTKVFAGNSPFDTYANSQGDRNKLVMAHAVDHPDQTIISGEIIHASLETAINSELPGMVRATVLSPVYSFRGEKVLVPGGARLVGQYTTVSGNGTASNRLFIIWNRIITPNGVSVQLNSPGADDLGRGGLSADAVNAHFFRIFGSASLLSILGAVNATSGVGDDEQPNSADTYRQAITNAFQSASQTILQKQINIKPTLHIHQGDEITVFVAHDLDFSEVMT